MNEIWLGLIFKNACDAIANIHIFIIYLENGFIAISYFPGPPGVYEL